MQNGLQFGDAGMIRAIVFDLDDTLYPEKEFVQSGYRSVAQHVAEACGYRFEDTLSCMLETFDAEGRQAVFPALLERFPRISMQVADLVQIYRCHNPKIRLFAGYGALLEELARHCRLGMITDGLPEVQHNKVRALDLEGRMAKIIYSWTYGVERQKPHPYAFSLMLEALPAHPGETLFVGDNPEKDGRGARNAGMHYAQVQHPGWQPRGPAAAAHETPEFVIESLFQLTPILRQLNEGGFS